MKQQDMSPAEARASIAHCGAPHPTRPGWVCQQHGRGGWHRTSDGQGGWYVWDDEGEVDPVTREPLTTGVVPVRQGWTVSQVAGLIAGGTLAAVALALLVLYATVTGAWAL